MGSSIRLFLRILARAIALSVLVSCAALAAEEDPQWEEIAGDHFLVYHQGSRDFAGVTAMMAEDYYRSINIDLGIDKSIHKEHLAFWLWDKRCKIYLYPDKESYLSGTKAPEWSGGLASPSDHVIISYVQSATFIESVLPHEIAHLFFREYVGQHNKEVPRWLSEGVAEYAEFDRRKDANLKMRNAVRAGNYIRPEELQGLQTTGLSAERASLFYAEAISLVNFLIDTYGSERFLILTDHLRDGYPFLRGLGAATYGQLDTLEKLHVAWVRYLTGSDPVASSPPVADLPRPGTSTQGAGKGLVFKQNSVGDGTALNIDSNGAGSPAPDFTLEEFLSGRQVSLSDYIGRKVILLDFWATWCDLCKEQVPMLVKLQNEWKGYGVQVLAVALSPGDPGDRKKIQRLADRYGINYPVLLDTDYKVAQELYKLKGAIPLALFIDCKGSLFYEYVGNDQNAIEVFSGVLETCTRDPACSM